MRKILLAQFIVLSLVAAAGVYAWPGEDAAAGPVPDLVVTRTDDPIPDGCNPGDCSLREALLAAGGATPSPTVSPSTTPSTSPTIGPTPGPTLSATPSPTPGGQVINGDANCDGNAGVPDVIDILRDTALLEPLPACPTSGSAELTAPGSDGEIASSGGGLTIGFDIPGEGVNGYHVIRPTEELPPIIANSLTIDGFTEAGSSPNTAGAFQPGNAVIKIVIDGSLLTGDEFFGLWVGAQNVTIRGLSIVNFADEGIRFGTFPSATIQGNYIGLWPDGTAGPNDVGIYLRSSQPGNLIGGSQAAHRNVISGNVSHGVDVSNTTAVVISGNFIGTDPSGASARPNGAYGVNFSGGPGTTIGGGTPEAGNLISGNGLSGIALTTSDARNINVKGNRIGTAANGTSALGNDEHGIYLAQGAHDNTLGGEFVVGEQNVIAYNGEAGVALAASAGVNNYIDPSKTHSNGGLGTDLLDDGLVLPNDATDGDTGPNSLMNYPVISSAVYNGQHLRLQGSLTSLVDAYNIFAFLNQECDPSGYGEGERFLSPSIPLTIGGGGTATFDRTYLNLDLQGAQYVTMSASDPESTSEFSECAEIQFTGASESIAGQPSAQLAPASVAPDGSGADADCSGSVDPRDALRILLAQENLDFEPPPVDCPDVGQPVEGSLQGGVLATFQVIDEQFKVWVTDDQAIEDLLALEAGTSQANIPIGPVEPGSGQAAHNAPWSWHYDPQAIEMAEAAIELCDGLPSYVEEHLDEFPTYCPWSAELIELQDFT